MSIHPRKLSSGETAWRCRYRDPYTGENRSKTFASIHGNAPRRKGEPQDRANERHAKALDEQIKELKSAGSYSRMVKSQQLVADFAREHWFKVHVSTLKKNTQKTYATIWDNHVLPHVGAYTLAELEANPLLVEHMAGELRAAGVGDEAVRKALTLLGACMRMAIRWQIITSDPTTIVKKSGKHTKRTKRAHNYLPVDVIERARLAFLDRGETHNALLVTLSTYCFLRPGEALAVTPAALGSMYKLFVAHTVSSGEIVEGTKTGADMTRSVELVPALVQDLQRYIVERGLGAGDLLFPGTGKDGQWSETQYRNWRRRVFRPAMVAAGAPANVRPYDLRHTGISLRLKQGWPLTDVAHRAGHDPDVTAKEYAGTIAGYDPDDRTPLEDRVARTRAWLEAERAAGAGVAYPVGAAERGSNVFPLRSRKAQSGTER